MDYHHARDKMKTSRKQEKKDLREKEEEEQLYARMKKNLAEFEKKEQEKIKQRLNDIKSKKKEEAERKERIRQMFHVCATQKIDYNISDKLESENDAVSMFTMDSE